jgi:hypothetical protein
MNGDNKGSVRDGRQLMIPTDVKSRDTKFLLSMLHPLAATTATRCHRSMAAPLPSHGSLKYKASIETTNYQTLVLDSFACQGAVCI